MIGYAREKDRPQVRALWELGFGAEEPYTSWYFREVYQSARTLLYWEEDAACSSLQLAPYKMSVAGRAVQAAYIVGVVTAPARRGRGYAGALLRRALNDLARDGAELALLFTDIPGFYEPLGWTCCYHLRRLHFPAAAGYPGPGWEKTPPTEGTLACCQAIYERMCQGFSGYVLRTARNWQTYVGDWLTDARNGLYVGPGAYFLTDRGEKGLAVKEIGYRDASALQDALARCAQLAAELGYPEFGWDAPQSCPLPRQENESLIPWVMARVTGRTELSPEDAAAATRRFLGAPDPRLWVGEIT